MSAPIKTGLVSFGISSKTFHAPFLTTVPGFALTSVVERSTNEAEKSYTGIVTYRSIEAMLQDPELELVVITSPNDTHQPYAKAAMLALNPRVMIPTQYATLAADKSTCDLVPVTNFLALVKGMNVSFLKGNPWSLRPADLPKDGTLIRVFNESSVLKS